MDKLTSHNVREIAEKLNEVLENKNEVSYVTTAATLALTEADSGKTIVLAKADGIAVTLPLAKAGLKFRFIVAVGASGGSYAIHAGRATDLMIGALTTVVTNTHSQFAPNGSSHYKITLNGGTTGGIANSYIDIEAIADNRWYVTGRNVASGTAATPFS